MRTLPSMKLLQAADTNTMALVHSDSLLGMYRVPVLEGQLQESDSTTPGCGSGHQPHMDCCAVSRVDGATLGSTVIVKG